MRHLHTSIKMFIVGAFSTMIAYYLGVTNYLTAGIIGILSIHATKLDSFQNGVFRFLDGLLAVLLSAVLFYLVPKSSHMVLYFGLLFVFPLLSFVLKIAAGIVPSLVLVTHFLLVSDVTWGFILEETLIVIIAITMAMAVNLLYPIFGLKTVDSKLHEIDILLQKQLTLCTSMLSDKSLSSAQQLASEEHLTKKLNEAILYVETFYKDALFEKKRVYLDYLMMRKTQHQYLGHIFEHIKRIGTYQDVAEPIVLFINQLVLDIGRENRADMQMKKLRKLFIYYRQETDLPQTRSEFEVRATFYQILYELKYFLNIKINFHKMHVDFQLESLEKNMDDKTHI